MCVYACTKIRRDKMFIIEVSHIARLDLIDARTEERKGLYLVTCVFFARACTSRCTFLPERPWRHLWYNCWCFDVIHFRTSSVMHYVKPDFSLFTLRRFTCVNDASFACNRLTRVSNGSAAIDVSSDIFSFEILHAKCKKQSCRHTSIHVLAYLTFLELRYSKDQVLKCTGLFEKCK